MLNTDQMISVEQLKVIEEKMKVQEIEEYLASDNFDDNYFEKLIPYYKCILDEDFKSNQIHYIHEIAFLKGCGYKVFRSTKGLHKLQYVDYIELT